MHSDYQSVKEQSGIFAGDGGYTIDIAGHSHLEGGLVTSTRQAESQGLNRFKTGTLSYGDIANHANYRGSAMSMEGQITLAGQDGPKKVGNQQLLDVAKYAGESQRALGVGQTRDSQQSTTRSGINTANLEITDMARQQMQLNYQTAPAIQMNSGITVGNPHPVKRDNPVSLQAHLAGIKTDTDTQTVAQQAQALTNRFDKDKVQRELDFQVNTTKQFGQTLAEAKRQTKAHLLTNASEQTKQYVDWAFDTIGAGLTTGSVQAAGVAAVSPFANRTIKQLTTDRQTGETNLVTNTLAHAALGALEAKVTGNNAAAGAMAGAGGELAAHFAAKAYGVDGKTKTTQDLTEQEKATVKTLGQLGGMAAGGLIGDNSQSTVNSMQIAERAVEHNSFGMMVAQDINYALAITDKNCDERCKERFSEIHLNAAEAQAKAYITILGVGLAPQIAMGSTIVAGSFGGASELLGQLTENNWDITKVDKTKVGISVGTGIVTKNMGVFSTALTNSGVEVADALRTGGDPIQKGAVSFGATLVGGTLGKMVEVPLNNKLNPTWKIKYSEKKGHLAYGISESHKPSNIPSLVGNTFDNISGKTFEIKLNEYIQRKAKNDQKE